MSRHREYGLNSLRAKRKFHEPQLPIYVFPIRSWDLGCAPNASQLKPSSPYLAPRENHAPLRLVLHTKMAIPIAISSKSEHPTPVLFLRLNSGALSRH